MALELNNVGLYFAENYLTLQDAINAMPARGGTLVLSNKDYTLTSKLVIDKPVTIIGQGAGDNLMNSFVTKIGTASATIDMIEFAAPNITFKRLGLVNTATTPTAGSGIKVTAGNPAPGEYPSGFALDQVGIQGFYDNINIVNAYQWSINRFLSYKATRYGILIDNQALPDGGDMNITNGYIQAMGRNTTAGIYQVASGGLKMNNIKFNSSPGNTHRIQTCYYGNVPTSSIVLINNCSFENYNVCAIKSTNTNFLGVSGSQFAAYKNTAIYSIDVDNNQGASIIGNIFRLRNSENGIRVQNSNDITLLNTYFSESGGTPVTSVANTNFLNLNT